MVNSPFALGNKIARLKHSIRALRIALKHPQVPRVAKLVIVLVAAYALSPVDLIPDFIPVLGWLDDAILVPAGIWLAIRLIPPPVWQECLGRAEQLSDPQKRSRLGLMLVVLIWLLALTACGWLLRDWIQAKSG